ncbi:MAG: right-handed parallel beta-helix repeat-containing protein [Bacteroidetes bacterium]|nr:right-handed parallel beta-helix repeat-containing protein [Bacteroidota bacterium]
MKKIFILCTAVICCLVTLASRSQSTVSFGTSNMVPADFAGFNGSNTIRTDMDFPYIDTDWLVDSVRQMAPGNLRFPPGSLANYWDWRIGHVQRAEDLPHGEEYAFDYGTMKYKDNTFDRFKGFVDRNGVSPIFVMNVLNSSKYYQTACLYYLRNLNLPLKYIEFGNELYNEHSSFMSNFPDAFAYARRCNEYATYMKSQPGMGNIKVAVVGATSRSNQPAYSRRNTWTQLVCDSLDNSVDAVTLHHYIGANVNGEQLSMSNINRFFASPFVAFDDLSPELASIKGAGKEAWLTETNIYDRTVCVNGSFAHGLLVGTLLLTMNEDPTITKYCAHSMVGNGTWAMIYNDTTGLTMESYYYPNSPCLGGEPKTLPHHFSPAGSVVKMIGQSVRNATTRRKLTFPGVPKLSSDYNYDVVYGWYFDGPLAGNAVIMNLSGQPQVITIPSNTWNLTGGVYEHLSAGPGGLLDLVTKNPSLNPSIGGMKSSGVLAATQSITLPPYSATRIYKKKNTGLVLSVGSTKICSGTQTSIVAEGGNSFTFSGAGITGYLSDNVAVFSATSTTTKNYTVTVTNNFGVTASTVITVYPKPVLNILTPPTVICGAGQPVNLKATLTGGNSALLKKFIWTPSENINAPDAANCIVYPTRSTTYTVFATDGQCFSAYDSVRVDIINEHEESINIEACTDQLPYQINLDFAKPGFTYKWFINSTQVNTGTYLNANPSVAKTVYTIKIVNNNDASCVDSMEITFNTYKCCTSNTPLLTIAPGSRISAVCELFKDYCTTSGIGFADGKMVENISANIVINGTLYIDRNYTFINCPNIRFAEGAKIEIIEGPFKLDFEKCSLRLAGCATKMWGGIVTNEYNQEITLNDSYICDATSAITCKNDPNLFINNTTFDANYISMTLVDNEGTLKGIIENSRFTQTRPLIAPYANKKTFAHFKLTNVANFVLGNNFGLPNKIENAEFGVYGENATVTAYNNHFNNIRSSDISKEYLASCIFIKNLNGYGNINDYNQLWPMFSVNAGHRNLQPEYGNKFSNCRNGIYVINAALNVYANEFTNCRRSIKSVGSMLKKNYIQSNTMTNSFASIDFVYNKGSEINIVGNFITTNNATTLDQTFFGMRVSDDPLSPSNTAILGNTIFSFGTYGIWIQNSRLADVIDNKIYMSHPTAIRESYGIYLENADSIDVDCNLIKGNGTSTALMENKTGITISMAPLTRAL